MKAIFTFLFVVLFIATLFLLITSFVFRAKKKTSTKKFFKLTGIVFVLSIVSFVGVGMTMTPEEKQEILAKQRAEEKLKTEEKQKAKEQKDAEDKLKTEEKQKAKEQKDAEDKLKAEEKQKAKEQKDAEDKLKAEEKQKAKEQKDAEDKLKDAEKKLKEQEEKMKKDEEKTNSTDKILYETEMKPQIDSMMKEYDDIWNQYWKPTWDKVNNNPNAINKRELQTQMELISEKYDKISNEVVKFKYDDKLKDPTLKKHLSDFRNAFVLATSYRSNAAKAVTQGIKGIAPMDDRMNESLKSVKLSDEKLINAVAALVSMENQLGILK
ncbi:hypothetical protein P4U07_16045 [Bacillus mycoides]|uniref:hypothetical protein n=1 Tax=Bacillus mycoides TaxID=1405 RepID=UPI002E1F57DC|nr:hypothetical protein [Bacillus mycoides]